MAKKNQFKLVLLGASSVGKSSVVLRFSRGEFMQYPESTIGAAFTNQTVTIDAKWDTAGQEKYRSLAPMYYRNACAAVVVYDITSMDTLKRAKSWVKELKKSNSICYSDIVIAFVGNKTDLNKQRKVSIELGEQYAKEEGLLFFEASAKSGKNINAIFKQIAKNLNLEKLRQYYMQDEEECERIERNDLLYWTNKQKKRKCCSGEKHVVDS